MAKAAVLDARSTESLPAERRFCAPDRWFEEPASSWFQAKPVNRLESQEEFETEFDPEPVFHPKPQWLSYKETIGGSKHRSTRRSAENLPAKEVHMFNTLYRCPRAIARHENGPLRESRVRYLEHLVAEGAAVSTVRRAAELMYRAAISMDLDESSPVERTEIERAAQEWANRPYGIAKRPEKVARAFRTFACGWLRCAGRLRESDRMSVPQNREIEAYCSYLETERGLSPRTIASARWSITRFFKDAPKRPLNRVSCADIETFLAQLGDQGWITRA